jgi:hypothetical protein
MAEQSLLAKLGLRLGQLGSAASLMIAAPLSNGDPSMAAHTDATRIGMYATHASNNGILGFVVGGVETLDIQGDGAATWIGIPTVSAPALSPANKGSLYCDSTVQGFMASYNGAAYAPLGGGGISGLTTGRVTVATSATTIGDFAPMVYSTAHGFSVNRAIGVPTTTNEMFGLDAGGSVTGEHNTMVGNSAGTTLAFANDDTLVGYLAGSLLTIGSRNTAVGSNALKVLASAGDTTAIGANALLRNTGGSNNTCVGSGTLQQSITASNNTAVGINALSGMDIGNAGGSEMTAVGAFAMSGPSSGLRNVAIGFRALSGGSSSPVDCVAIGWQASRFSSVGQRNIAIGSAALENAGSVSGNTDNVIIGNNAGTTLDSGVANIFLGSDAGDSSTSSASNRLVAGSSSAFISNVYIGNGELHATPQAFTLNGTSGIGTNITGASMTIAPGQGTGTGPGGALILKTSPAGTTGTALNALVTRWTVGADGGTTWDGIATVSAPALSPANKGSIYYDRTSQSFFASLNGGAYAAFGGGNLAGSLTATRVPFASGANTLTDSATMVFSTANGFSVNRSNGGVNNEMFGLNAGNATMTGNFNTFVGENAGLTITTADNNTAVGRNALVLNSVGTGNTAVGVDSLHNSTAANNTAVGMNSMINQSGVSNLTAVGFEALKGNATPANNTGTFNTAVGYQAGTVNSTGSDNTFVGYQAGLANTSGSDNTVLGYQAGLAIIGANNNTFVGSLCGKAVTTGNDNTAVGQFALPNAITAGSNTAVGKSALQNVNNSPGNNNTAVGAGAGSAVTTGGQNIMIGASSGQVLTTGNNNIFIGFGAGQNSTTTDANLCVFGADAAAATDVWFGKGNLSATATAYTLHGTDGLGADKVGGNIVFAAGRSTGAGTAGTLIFQTAPASGSSSTLNALATRLTLDSLGNIVPGTAALGTGATDGFIYMQSCAGTPGGTPTAFTGRVATIIDTSAGKFWAYYGGGWHFALLT